MLKKQKSAQGGFAMVELVIFVVVIIAIGGIGYWRLSSSGASTSATDQQILNSEDPETLDGRTSVAPSTAKIVNGADLLKSNAASLAELVKPIATDSTISARYKEIRTNMVTTAYNQIGKAGTTEGAAGKYVAIPDAINKYMKYTEGYYINPITGEPKDSYCKVGTAQDPNRNDRYYPKNWAASFTSWVISKSYGNTTGPLKHCSSRYLAFQASSWYKQGNEPVKIDDTHSPKAGDIVLHNASLNKWGFPTQANRASIFAGYLQGYGKSIPITIEGNSPEFTTSFFSENGIWKASVDKPNFSSKDGVRLQVHGQDYWNYYINISNVK